VSGHYDELDRVYREIWGEHVHHGFWRNGDETPAEAAELLIEFVSEKLDLVPGLELCDIGCGYGATAEFLAARHGVAVTGLTISSAQARIAEARKPAAGSFRCLHRDWLENGLADESFDRAYAIESSEHMADKRGFFDQAWRTLRPSGRLVVCAWLAGPQPSAWEVDHLLEPICREGRLPGMGSREDYEALASEAGFQLLGYDDISAHVRRTWSICARRVMAKIVTDPYFRTLIFSSSTRNRVFFLTLFRLIWALRTGAMRYGVFVWQK
jgi:tocopherol O-methyltransferase